MAKKLDTYQQWVKEGKADAYLSSIRRWVSDNATQKQIAKNLHISEKTLISLKQKHKEIRDAFAEGDDILKVELENAILKRARGMKLEDEVQTYEMIDGGKRKKQKIVKTKKEIPPTLKRQYIFSKLNLVELITQEKIKSISWRRKPNQ